MAEYSLHPHAIFIGLDLPGIGWADCSNSIGVDDAGLKKAYVSPKLKTFHLEKVVRGEGPLRKAFLLEKSPGNLNCEW